MITDLKSIDPRDNQVARFDLARRNRSVCHPEQTDLSYRRVVLKLRARAKYGPEIVPCCKKAWCESYTIEKGSIVFWFNSPDGSTHIVKEKS